MAVEDINFLDLVCLLRITPETVMEKFGSLINTSFFDASTIAGTLKQKDLVEFSTNYPGPNGILLTQNGKNLINEAESKSSEKFDTLDMEILRQMSGGKRMPFELGNTLNVRSRDLALRLYKLYKQGFLIYELKNGNVELLLTENGFLKLKEVPQVVMGTTAQIEQQPQAAAQPGAQPEATPETQQAQKEVKKGGRGRLIITITILVILLIIAVLLYLKIL
jgi:hypothetical protein